MSYTETELSALKKAYARGVLEAVLPDGSRVRYRSTEDMERIIANLETELGQRPAHNNVIYPTYSNGFD